MSDASQGDGPGKPRNPWRRFRRWPRWAQIMSWVVLAFIVLVAIGATAGEGAPGTNQVATVTTTTSATTTTSSNGGSTTTSTSAPTTTSTTTSTTSTSTSTTSTTPPAPSTTLAPTTTLAPSPARQSALAALAQLAIKGRAPKTGFSREQFGPAWSDDVNVPDGHNGCDTRNDILRRDLTQVTIKSGSHGCTVLSGTLRDPYTNTVIRFMRGTGTSQAVQIDHVVSLGNAWQTGAQQLSMTVRVDLANDPLNLLAVSRAANEQKGDADAATWLPPNRAYRCPFVARQIAVKLKYHLWVTPPERDAMRRVLGTCPNQTLPVDGAQPSTVRPGPPSPSTPPTSTAPPAPTTSVPPSTPPPTESSKPVTPGAFCSEAGARGRTAKGVPMVCTPDPNGRHNRWRRA